MNMTRAEYEAIDAVNISTLVEIERSPLHYLWAKNGGGRKSTTALEFGTLTHLRVFEPQRYEDLVVVWPKHDEAGKPQQRRGKAWDAFEAAHRPPRIIATEADHETCGEMRAAAMRHPAAAAYLSNQNALCEVTMTWRHPLGIDCKGRIDWVDIATDVIVDLKTARRADMSEFGRAAARLHYATKAAWYADGYRARHGRDPVFVLIVVEKEAPFAVAVYRMPEHAIEAGRAHYERLLLRLKACRDQDTWPGLAGDEEVELELPDWAFAGDDGLDLEIDGEVLRV